MDKFKRIVKIKDYGYIENRYGNSNHYNIMMDLHENGPLVLSFQPDDLFSVYSGGVYQGLKKQDWVDANIERPQWTNVDHSVLLIGWGSENGLNYWLC